MNFENVTNIDSVMLVVTTKHKTERCCRCYEWTKCTEA